MDKNAETKKDRWDKAKITSGVIASVFIPAVLALIGHWSSEAIRSREIAVKYTELAVDILTKPATPGSEDLRGWSIDVISRYSGVSMNNEARSYLKKNELALQFLDENWVPTFTDKVAKSVVERERWRMFISNPGDKENQMSEIKGILEGYYQQIKIRRQRLIGQ